MRVNLPVFDPDSDPDSDRGSNPLFQTVPGGGADKKEAKQGGRSGQEVDQLVTAKLTNRTPEQGTNPDPDIVTVDKDPGRSAPAAGMDSLDHQGVEGGIKKAVSQPAEKGGEDKDRPEITVGDQGDPNSKGYQGRAHHPDSAQTIGKASGRETKEDGGPGVDGRKSPDRSDPSQAGTFGKEGEKGRPAN